MIERSDNAAGSMGRHGQVASDAAAKWQGAFAAARPLSSRRYFIFLYCAALEMEPRRLNHEEGLSLFTSDRVLAEARILSDDFLELSN